MRVAEGSRFSRGGAVGAVVVSGGAIAVGGLGLGLRGLGLRGSEYLVVMRELG